jgi:hypothetical protein
MTTAEDLSVESCPRIAPRPGMITINPGIHRAADREPGRRRSVAVQPLRGPSVPAVPPGSVPCPPLAGIGPGRRTARSAVRHVKFIDRGFLPLQYARDTESQRVVPSLVVCRTVPSSCRRTTRASDHNA